MMVGRMWKWEILSKMPIYWNLKYKLEYLNEELRYISLGWYLPYPSSRAIKGIKWYGQQTSSIRHISCSLLTSASYVPWLQKEQTIYSISYNSAWIEGFNIVIAVALTFMVAVSQTRFRRCACRVRVLLVKNVFRFFEMRVSCKTHKVYLCLTLISAAKWLLGSVVPMTWRENLSCSTCAVSFVNVASTFDVDDSKTKS